MMENGYSLDSETLTMTLHSIGEVKLIIPDDSAETLLNANGPEYEKPGVWVTMNSADKNEIGVCYAYGSFDPQPTNRVRSTLCINWLTSNRDYRRQGWGEYILLETLRAGKAAGYAACILGTDVTNTPARTLYAKHGFTDTYVSTAYRK